MIGAWYIITVSTTADVSFLTVKKMRCDWLKALQSLRIGRTWLPPASASGAVKRLNVLKEAECQPVC